MGKNPFFSPIASAANPIFSPAAIHIMGIVRRQIISVCARQIRIIFDGRESSEPVIANMVLACKVPVNIMHADTRDIEGKAMGQMIIQLPEDDTDAGRICNYLKTANVKFEEVR